MRAVFLFWSADHLSLSFSVRYVYLASDDASVLEEAESTYPEITFITDRRSADSARLDSRYTEESFTNVFLDIYFLSQTDYLVATFSSQV